MQTIEKMPVPQLMSLRCCPVCGDGDRRRLFELNPYTVFECRDCGLRYIDPCLSPDGMRDLYSSTKNLVAVNAFHASYYDYSSLDSRTGTVREFEYALDIAAEGLGTSPRSVFDAGCGNGLFLAVAKRKGWEVCGCDSSLENISRAKSKFGLDIMCADFLNSDCGGEKYDVISFWDVLEHLNEPHSFIQKAQMMLRPGGRILIGGPNDRSFLRIMAEAIFYMSGGLCRGPLKKPYLLEHVTYYTIETLQRLLDSHGFRLVSSFASSTDLKKYHFSIVERLVAASVLTLGKCLGLQNRLIAIFEMHGPVH